MTSVRLPPPALFINRELSWLEFNARVLHEALDPRVPLLERLKFLSIFSTNLDEFYMVRVAGLRRKARQGAAQYPPDGLTPAEQLTSIQNRVRELLALRDRCLHEQLLPALAGHGVRLVRMSELAPAEWMRVDEFFESQVFPILTPLAVDPGHPFPYISNLSLSLAVELRDPAGGEEHFARVKVPRLLSRWVPTGTPNQFVPLEEVIGANLAALFPGMEVLRWFAFRISRYSDLDLGQIDQVEDLLDTVEQQVFRRRFGEVVRLEVQEGMPPALRTLLLEELNDAETQSVSALTEDEVHESGRLLELGDLMALTSLDFPQLKDPPHVPILPSALRDGAGSPPRSIFDVIRERDVLVHHPFHSFDASVERFVEEAAADPNVLAIKLTLYRTSGDTEIVSALADAAQAGKQVAVLVELQARFDEVNNIQWARTLERYGIHVAYGLPGLKTHCKTALVVRRDADGSIRRYCHLGSGNYNSKTARLYTDIGLFTASPSIGADLSDLFNTLTGFSRQRLYRKLLVAPANLRERILTLIERETAHARAGRPARIVAKMNALVDPETIAALYQASQAGVEIDLIVRGICCLRPGIEGVSDRIRVLSIVGRFLEHSRVFRFDNDGAPEYYIGSADWMPRNFDRRVEALVPVEDPALHALLGTLLETCLQDNRQAWELHADGTYRQRHPAAEEGERATHLILQRDPWGRALPSPVTGEMPAVLTGD
ncbi:polyphosphate kinase 1 [Roseisolibacter sp. H3M3-2]|uniref:polyphosphate kinase 1 n=1 Tax=Roseisolibacter sp. H3M3-2 TaxID=3031323 RepID=UPI0023DC9C2D|nr:polyphosphate kinase 1 [Roseisolibacter sp. H3M3-2]MDF1503264.1 polyphosphate kinase 1 [Roseisolibacter sp. H3M3-2]